MNLLRANHKSLVSVPGTPHPLSLPERPCPPHSVQDLLQLHAEDAEDTLYRLGFGGCDEPQVTARIPARFFSFPSQLHGINFRVFLESQLARLHQEDPGLSLASKSYPTTLFSAFSTFIIELTIITL